MFRHSILFFLLLIVPSVPVGAGIAFPFPPNLCPAEIADTLIPTFLHGRLTSLQRRAIRQLPLLRTRIVPDLIFTGDAISLLDAGWPLSRLHVLLDEKIDRHETQFDGGIFGRFVEQPESITFEDVRNRRGIAWDAYQLLQDEIVFFRYLGGDRKLPRYNLERRADHFRRNWLFSIQFANGVYARNDDAINLKILWGEEATQTLNLAQILAVSNHIPENYRAVLRSYLWTLSYHKLHPTNLFLHFCEALDQL